jgi:hypothetical protein
LPVWQKTFLKVMTVCNNAVRPSNLQQYLLLHFIAPDPCYNPLTALADRETAWR